MKKITIRLRDWKQLDPGIYRAVKADGAAGRMLIMRTQRGWNLYQIDCHGVVHKLDTHHSLREAKIADAWNGILKGGGFTVKLFCAPGQLLTEVYATGR